MKTAASLAACGLLLLPHVLLGQQEIAEVIEWPSTVGAVSFPHLMHVEDLELECADCHHETNATRLDMPHPEYFEDFWIDCTSCHHASAIAAAPQACSNCHHDSPVTVADETLSSKVVVHRSCWNCHEVSTGVEASKACATCHKQSSHQKSTTQRSAESP